MADLLVENAQIVDVLTHRVYRGYVTIASGRFVEVEEGDPPSAAVRAAHVRLDAQGMVMRPGLIDTHMHIESSLVTPMRFAEAVLPWGTTTILQDPHEIANVLGARGIRWMIRASQGLPLRIYSAIPSCVPATSPAIETPNAALHPEDVLALAQEEGVLALGEMMDYHGLLEGDEHRKAMLRAGAQAGLSLEGHAPSLTGQPLSRYIAHGIRSDHTLMTPQKLREKLGKGLYVMLQEKSLTTEVVGEVMRLPDRSRVLLVTDDVMPNRLRSGHLSRVWETAVLLGWDPVDALASATLRPAVYLGLRQLGAIAPGYWADFMLSREEAVFPPEQVYVGGRLVAQRGRTVIPVRSMTPDERDLTRTAFKLTSLPDRFFYVGPEGGGRLRARVIRVNEQNTFTTLEEREVAFKDGMPLAEDLALAVVVARSSLTGSPCERGNVVLLAGLGLDRGAYASTFAHDSHNVLVVGKTPAAMRRALEGVLGVGGGMTFVPDDHSEPILLPLPVAGLLTDAPIDTVGAAFDRLETALRQAGVRAKNPVLLLTILPLTVSPEFKLSDKGLVDVENRQVVAAYLPT